MDRSNPTSIIVDIDTQIVSVANVKPQAWQHSSSRARRIRTATERALQDHERPQWPQYFVTLLRCSAGTLDGDNLQAAFKHVRDQVAAWLGLDDADPRIAWAYAQKVVKVQNDRPGDKSFFKTWARVYVSPEPNDLAAEQVKANLAAPRSVPTELEDHGTPRNVQRPKAIPELAGGKPEVSIELAPRANSVASRVRVRAMRNTRDSGIGRHVPYFHIAAFWAQNGLRWRSQGVVVRLEEARDIARVLWSLADRYGVPVLTPLPGGQKRLDSGRGVTDTGSDDTFFGSHLEPAPASDPNIANGSHPESASGPWTLTPRAEPPPSKDYLDSVTLPEPDPIIPKDRGDRLAPKPTAERKLRLDEIDTGEGDDV